MGFVELESTLRMTDYRALTKDGIHFTAQQGRRWINDDLQKKVEEQKEELRATNSVARIRLARLAEEE